VAVVVFVMSFTTVALADTTVTIFHTNDMHGRFVSTGANIVGMDAIAAMYAATDNAILVDAGDTIHGLPFVNLSRGLDAVELMSAAGYRLMAPGNHEFNFGYARLLELAALADFEVISANAFRGGQLLFAPTSIVEIDGVTIGFIGLSNPNTGILTNANNVRGITFGDFVVAAEQGVAELQAAGVDFIVALAHLGSGVRDEFRIDGFAFELAEAVSGIDIIVDGHSHTRHVEGLLHNDVLIVQAGGNAAFLGRVDITVADGEIVDITATTLNRADIVEELGLEQETRPMFGLTASILVGEFGDLLRDLMDEQEAYLGVVVAQLPEALGVENIRAEEMPAGNLVADAMLWATNADIALQNGGGLRAPGLPLGDVTVGSLYTFLPFGSIVVTVELTSAQIWAMLNHSLGALTGDIPSGGFLQVAGISFTFNPDAPFGARVTSATVGGVELDPQGTARFMVALPSFVATEQQPGVGGDGFPLPVGVEWVEEFQTLDEVLVDFLNSDAFAVPVVEGRIAVAVAAEYVAEEPAVEEPVADEPVVDEPVVDEPVVEEPVVAEPVADEPVVRLIDTVQTRMMVGGVEFVWLREVARVYGLEAYLVWDVTAGTATLNSPAVSFVVVIGQNDAFLQNERTFVPIEFALLHFEA
jgi:2',3'-cyclic-nucleotide 2'-phosphodiesterase (5'-nucleotidase family)